MEKDRQRKIKHNKTDVAILLSNKKSLEQDDLRETNIA